MTSRNVAVFIDAENLFKGYGKLEIPDVSMADILKQIETAVAREAGAGGIALARAYADWNAIGLEDYRREVERSRVETVQVFSVSKAEKNAADIVLVVDCLRAASDLDQLEVFVIVSADGDFVPLVRRLHELDKFVVGATLANHPVNNVLEQEVDHYVPLKFASAPPAAALEPVFSFGEPAKKVAKKAARTRKPPAEQPAEAPVEAAVEQPVKKATKKQPAARQATKKQAAEKQPAQKQAAEKQTTRKQPAAANQPAGKSNWHDMAKAIPVVHTGKATSPADYKAIIKKVLTDSKVRSFCDKLANQGGTLPILAMALKAAAPELSPSDAKVSSLSRALRFALADTQYALARESDDVQPVLVRRQSESPGMLTDLSLDDIARGVQ